MLIPVYGFVEGDTLGVLVLMRSSMTVAEVSANLARSVKLRVAIEPPYTLYYDDKPLAPERTVADLGLATLSRIDLCRGVPKPRRVDGD